MGKWLGGIAAAIITGLLVWWLTHPGGPLNPVKPPPPPPPPAPHILITNFEVGLIVIPRDSVMNAKFTVYNEGDTTAKECRVWWHDHGEKFAPSGTPLFSLTPKERKEFSVQSSIYSEPRTYDSFAYVQCSNFRSEDVHRNVSVIRLP